MPSASIGIVGVIVTCIVTSMASLRRKPNSCYWIACFTDANGLQRQRSTKETNRGSAQRLAEKFEAAYATKLTEAQARMIMSDIYQEVRGETLYHSTTRKFMDDWLANKKVETTAGTFKRYRNAKDKLIKFLGDRAERDIAYIHKRDISALRDKTATELSASTANTDLKILRIAFAQAVVDGLRLDNPARAVKILKERRDDDATERRPFTLAEVKRVLAVSPPEWRGLILAGFYTGQRLGDVASMTWRMIDVDTRMVSFHAHKTNRLVKVPIAPALWRYLSRVPAHKPGDPVFPNAHQERVNADGESRRLSAQFHALLLKSNLVEKRSKKNTGRGHSVKRKTSELTFHSLRHTTTTLLKRTGAPESVAMDIIGHESDTESAGYTHIDERSKRAAINRLPDLG